MVIDEQFDNKTFDSFDDLLYQQFSGDLHYVFDGGELGENGFGYMDTIADLDGTGLKKWHYQYTQDSLIFFQDVKMFILLTLG
ncbi:MAG: hypothetical protein IPM77_13100 [Crocinitomicaceae bacterium]|nr:hypothetical protein [Crocinitomicaceae bacterium]